MERRFIAGIAALLMALCLAPAPAGAQGAEGSVVGTVTDVTGAVIPGASIDIVNKNTGIHYKSVSGQNGAYTIPRLPVGPYSITVSSSGFGTMTVPEVQVSVAFTSTINLKLKPAGAVQEITVTASNSETAVDTSTPVLSTLISSQKMLDLPLLDRDPNGLILLAPGVAQTQSGNGGFVVNGSRERNNNFLVDGADNNDTFVPGIPGGLSTPNIDATEEFRVLTGSYSAEYGRNTGGIVTVATKAGTNKFHGSAYGYYRSNAWAARDFFNNNGPIAPLQRRTFGGAVGGPILHNRTFFFINYEAQRNIDGFQSLQIVPSAIARTGILPNTPFGTLNIAAGGANNLSGMAFNPAIQQILNLYPLPNDTADSPVPGIFDGFRYSNFTKFHSNNVNTRVDHRFSDSQSLWGSYSISDSASKTDAATFPQFHDGLSEPFRNQVVSLNLVSTFSSRAINEAHFGYNRSRVFFNSAGSGDAPDTLSTDILSAFQASGIPTQQAVSLGANGDGIKLSTGAMSSLTQGDSDFRITGTTSVRDTFTRIFGAHTLKFGGEMDWVYENSANNFNRSEFLSFDVPTTFGTSLVSDSSGNPINPFASDAAARINNYASFLYGLVAQQFQAQFFNSQQQRVAQDYRGFRGRTLSLFAEDSWKVRRNLTLTLGLRWQYNTVPYEVNGLLTTLGQDASQPTPAGGFVFEPAGKNSGGKTNLYNDDYKDFGPRLGFAWDPFNNGKTSVRGGYGIYYDRIYGNLFGNARANPPFEQDLNQFFNFGTLDTTIQNLSRPASITTSNVVTDGANFTPIYFPLPGNNPFTSSMPMPREQKWSFGIEWELASKLVLEADYVGAKGDHEVTLYDGQLTSVPRVNALTGSQIPISQSGTTNLFNGRLNSAFQNADLQLDAGHSSYNSLQVKVTKTLDSATFGKGFIQGAYTWAHSIDDSVDPIVGDPGERIFPRDTSGFAGGPASEHGSSGFDVRHRFIMSFVYQFPFRFQNPWMKRLLGGFSVSGIASEQTGLPFSVFSGVDSAGSGFSQRADFAHNGIAEPAAQITNPLTVTGPPRQLFTSPCPADDVATGPASCSGPSLIGRQGNVGRNLLTGPHFEDMDLAVIKRIPVDEHRELRLQADMFNLLNHPNLGLPVNTIGSVNFGQSTFTVSNPRLLQVSARFTF